MTYVWWIGNGSSKTITSEQWLEQGIVADQVTWSAANGWSIQDSIFSGDQLDILSEDLEFLLGQTGPRLHKPPMTTGDARDSAYVYAKRTKDLYDGMPAYINSQVSAFVPSMTFGWGDAGEGMGVPLINGVPAGVPEPWPFAAYSGITGNPLPQKLREGVGLLVDGDYSLGSDWWATEVERAGISLSTDFAYTGTQSLKMSGGAQRAHYPNVTSMGASGGDGHLVATFGQVFGISLRVFRPSDNGSAGPIWGGLNLYGAGGSDFTSGFSVDQVDIPTDTWVTVWGFVTVPYAGTHAPYTDAVPIILTNTGSGDNLYIDTVRIVDITASTPSLIAPPPSGDRTIDTRNLQALSDRAQLYDGTVLLRAGTYLADIVTQRTRKQPRIVGQGKQWTFIDGTIKMQGDHVTAEGNFSGGWLEGFAFVGSHTGEVALEINGGSHMRGKELRVKGTYDVGLLFHNEQANEYTEQCSFAIDIGETCDIAVHYKVTAGAQSSFSGCGLEHCSVIEGNNGGNPVVLIDTDARPYNAPMNAHVWVTNDAEPIFQHNGNIESNFFGSLVIEAIGNGVSPNGTGMLIADGNPLYFGGSLNTYIASGMGVVNYGTLRVMSNVAAVGGVSPSMAVGPTFIGDIYGNAGGKVLILSDNGGANCLRFGNSDGRPTITPIGHSDMQFILGNGGGLQLYMSAGSSAFMEAAGAASVINLDFYTKNGIAHLDNNPVGAKVAVPANSTSAGKPGQWAASSTYHYAYTGDGTTHSWVRSSVASW